MLIVSVSAALLLGVAVVVLVKWAGLKAWHAVICVAFGFNLAATSLAPTIRKVMAEIARFIAG